MVAVIMFLMLSPSSVVGVRVLWMGDSGEKVHATRGQASPKAGTSSPDETDRLLREALAKMDELAGVVLMLDPELKETDPIRQDMELEHRANVPPNEIMASALPLPGIRPLSMPAMGGRAENRPYVSGVKLAAGKCRFRLSVKNSATQPGDKLMVVGDHELLGNWQVPRAQLLSTTAQEFPVWSTEIDFEQGINLEFKCILQTSEGKVQWEDGLNRKVSVPKEDAGGVKCKFNRPGEKVMTDARALQDTAARAMAPAGAAAGLAAGLEATFTMPFMPTVGGVQLRNKEAAPIPWNSVAS